ncbi:hypothetical protein NCAS_0H02130 [Naumovozyma castellii]|uniref:SGNH hydrolase-type esterase domain-containing protein n=1 Tax=Naumovozyma castellii TaxID=27288 RepID=G0VJ44_NAUCA|nr:hypothetical protein NCAS_0H02130 [Naumovozyma castellii CBS 4309]CCC71523.1 hypothetical protein NCAS_0H02130 [Naumovozyma castellii CBS 4309]
MENTKSRAINQSTSGLMSLQYDKFLLFGDSITEFSFNPEQFSLGAALANAYARRLDIVHRGFAGYTSRWALHILPRILEVEQNVVLSTLFFGANDVCLKGPQSVPIDEYETNMESLIGMLLAKGIKVLLIGPGLLDRGKWEPSRGEEIQKGWIRTEENLKKYGDVLKKIAKGHPDDVVFIDLAEAFAREAGDQWKELLADGLHFSGKGYQVFFDEVMKAIAMNFPQFVPDNIEFKLPLWREVNEDGLNI